MSDIDKLVENYFAPKTKTLTKKMVYEIVERILDEEASKKSSSERPASSKQQKGSSSKESKNKTKENKKWVI